MADKTIGDLAEALQINDNDLFVLEQGGTGSKGSSGKPGCIILYYRRPVTE